MLPALLILSGLFALAFVARVGSARRAELLRRWPAFVLGGAAVFALLRGALWPAAALALAAVLVWMLWPRLEARRPGQAQTQAEDPADIQARDVLGVTRDATEADIRRAYRTKIAAAHPDRGGSHNEAARLTAARDRLLRRRR